MTKTRKKTNSVHSLKMIPEPAFATYPQNKSRFFQHLPQELRDKIYSHVFFSTGLAYGLAIKTTPNALAMLQTCHRAEKEIGDTWISQVFLSFQDLKLSNVPFTR